MNTPTTTTVTANIHTSDQTSIQARDLTDTRPAFVSIDVGAGATIFIHDSATAHKLGLAAARAKRLLAKKGL